MSKQDLIAELQGWLTAEGFAPDRQKFEGLKTRFEQLRLETEQSQRVESMAEGEPETEFEYRKTQEDTRFDELSTIYNDKRRAMEKERAADMENNFREKTALIQELQSLIHDEENISKAYKRFSAIKQKWNEIGAVNNAKRRDIQSEYSRLIEQFYYNIHIYRELQINDLKKNLVLKQEVLEKIKLLENEKSIHQVDFFIHQYLEEWDHIGPTIQKEWETIREEFKTAVAAVFERIRQHRKEVRNSHKENYDKKRALVERVAALAQAEPTEPAEVQKLTKEVKEIQEQWRHIGHAGHGKNDSVWTEFRAACDVFFSKRATFIEASSKELAGVKAKKKALIEKAKELHKGEDHEAIAGQLKTLQRQWKEAGKLLPQEESRMFRQFRSYCDDFFERRKAQAKEAEAVLKQNLKAKEELVERFTSELEQELSAKGEQLITAWKEQWAAVGEVHEKAVKRLEDAFNALISKAYKGLGISKTEVAQKEFQSKIEILSSRGNAQAGLSGERANVQQKLKEAEAAVLALEDKLAFFRYSNDSNPLKKDLLDRIAHAKKEADEWRARRKQIDLTIKGLNAPKPASVEEGAAEPTQEGGQPAA